MTVFIAVRQDVLRWALSKYHGDGTGKPGHLQFRLASGRISREEIGPITVDRQRFARIVETCEEIHAEKRKLQERLHAAGIRTAVLRYEDFLSDPHAYLARLLETIGVEVDAAEIDAVLARGTRIEKVHADDVREFVENADEVLAEFGDAYVAW